MEAIMEEFWQDFFFFSKQLKKIKRKICYVVMVTAISKILQQKATEHQTTKLLVWLFGFLVKQFIYKDPLPLPYAATSVSVHAQVRHHLQIVCVCRISVLELQNSTYHRFLHVTRTSSVRWAESLPHMAIDPHFVAFPACTIGTKRCSCTPLASQDMAGLFVGTTSTLWTRAVSRLCGLGIITFPTAGKKGFQNSLGH